MTNLWNVSSELLQNCYQMSLDNDLTDVTFVTTDLDEVRAHKVILSAVSPYLKKMMHNIKTKLHANKYFNDEKAD